MSSELQNNTDCMCIMAYLQKQNEKFYVVSPQTILGLMSICIVFSLSLCPLAIKLTGQKRIIIELAVPCDYPRSIHHIKIPGDRCSWTEAYLQ